MKVHSFQIIQKMLCLFLALGICISSTACGDASQAEPDSGEQEALYYSMHFRDIPDPDEALYENSDLAGHEECHVLEKKRIYQDDRIYRFLYLTDNTSSFSSGSFSADCLQIFHEDAWSWETILLPREGWLEDKPVSIENLVGATAEGAFFRVTYYAVDGEYRYLAYFDGSDGKILTAWPDGIEDASVCRDRDQNIYFVCPTEKAVYAYGSDGQQLRRTSLDGYLWGGICNPENGGMLWYGSTSESARLWKDLSKPDSYDPIKVVAPYEFRITYAPDGTLYYADAEAIWMQKGEQPRQIISIVNKGYRLEDLYSIRVQEDGDIHCYVFLDGTLCLLSLHCEEEGTALEQQEITLYYHVADVFLQQIVTRFNRRNPQYHITILTPEDSPRAWIEIATGQGPDLFFLSPTEAEDFLRQGYIRNMEEMVEDSSLFLDAALECGRIDGVTYGIPYSCTPKLVVFSREIVGDRHTWTVGEMMQCIRASDARILDWYFGETDAVKIVICYGLYDNENTDYIDWKKGESHLTEQPFRELLEFAKEYADPGDYETSEVLSMLRSGEIAGTEIGLWRSGQLDYADNLFSGNASYIGYPTSTGKKGVYIRTNCLYMNQASDKVEGVKEFIQFMLSEEAQKLCIADNECFNLPVRLSAISYLVEWEQAKAKEPKSYAFDSISWQEDGLDERQLQVWEELLEQAQPAKFYVTELYGLLEEELEPYFLGERSLEETVKILDSRVQLYLDEKGPR